LGEGNDFNEGEANEEKPVITLAFIIEREERHSKHGI